MSNCCKEYWKNIYQTLLLNKKSFTYHIFVFWFFVLFFSRIFSIYIPQLALSISSSSLFFLILGFLFPNIYSLLLASMVDICVCLIKSYFSFNIFFFLQPLILVCIGWLIRFLLQTQNIKLTKNLFVLTNIFGIFLSIFFDYHIFYYVLFIMSMWFIFGRTFKNALFILLALSISAYLVSFLLGVNGAFLLTNSNLTSLLFKTRVIKEIVKNFLLFFSFDLFLRKYGCEQI